MPVIELDLLIGLVNRDDHLHRIAIKFFEMVRDRMVRDVSIATSALMEYSLVLRSKGIPETEIQRDIALFRSIRNIGEAYLTSETLIKATELRMIYGLTYFDSLHAATAILRDGVIISTDKAYSKIDTIKHIDPRQIVG